MICLRSSEQRHSSIATARWGNCVGIFMPASHMAYFQAVKSRWSLHRWNSGSVSVGRISRQAASKPARAAAKSGSVVPLTVWLYARVETATPFISVDVDRAARAPRDRADMDFAVIDVPTVLVFGVATAGEGGHGPIIPPITRLKEAARVGIGTAIGRCRSWMLISPAGNHDAMRKSHRTVCWAGMAQLAAVAALGARHPTFVQRPAEACSLSRYAHLSSSPHRLPDRRGVDS